MDNRIWETKKKSGKAEKSDQQQQQVVGEEQQKSNRRRNWTRSTTSGSSLTKEGFSLNPAVCPNLLPSSAVPTDLIWCHVQWLDLWTSTRWGKHAEDQRIQVSVKPSAVRIRAVDIICFFWQEATTFLSTSCKERTRDIKHAFSFYLSVEAPFLRWLLNEKCTSLSPEKLLR
jgi:hypothetical protein